VLKNLQMKWLTFQPSSHMMRWVTFFANGNSGCRNVLMWKEIASAGVFAERHHGGSFLSQNAQAK
jgi:hypothetical protein